MARAGDDAVARPAEFPLHRRGELPQPSAAVLFAARKAWARRRRASGCGAGAPPHQHPSCRYRACRRARDRVRGWTAARAILCLCASDRLHTGSGSARRCGEQRQSCVRRRRHNDARRMAARRDRAQGLAWARAPRHDRSRLGEAHRPAAVSRADHHGMPLSRLARPPGLALAGSGDRRALRRGGAVHGLRRPIRQPGAQHAGADRASRRRRTHRRVGRPAAQIISGLSGALRRHVHQRLDADARAAQRVPLRDAGGPDRSARMRPRRLLRFAAPPEQAARNRARCARDLRNGHHRRDVRHSHRDTAIRATSRPAS